MKDLGSLMKQAQAMQAKMAEFQANLEQVTVEGRSGGGMVAVTLSGKGGMTRLSVDLSLIKPEDKEMLEDLIVAAHADARAKLEERMAAEMAKITGGLPLPPGFKLPF
jgi:DNA-binding YbaB/EbfC family protein